MQLDAMRQAGIEDIVDEVQLGSRDDRPNLAALLGRLQPGDELVVWRLDRLGRSMRHLLDTVEELRQRGVGFRSLTEDIDTVSPTGEFVFRILAALAQFERGLTDQRRSDGIAAAKARGKRLGRPDKLTGERLAAARAMIAAGRPIAEVARVLEVSRMTLYRHANELTGAAVTVVIEP
jgi:DNA invertase Pin-like site-specific DNA recombinase